MTKYARRCYQACEAARPVLFIDNATSIVESSAWEAFLTAPGGIWTGRILGESRDGVFRSNVLVIFTGSNATLAGNLCERILSCRILSKSEEPFLLQFPFDPVELTKAERPQMIVAALVLLRAFIAAGKPVQTRSKLGSFKQWDSLVRQCVIWLGVGDPIGNIQRMRALDTGADIHVAFMRALFELKAEEPWSVADLTELRTHLENEALIEAINEATAGTKHTPAALGNWIKSVRDKRSGGFRISQAGKNRQNAALWRVIQGE